jgi:hypothetical protein
MNLADNNQNVSSLNIFTLIKEVYQSIKNFHKKLDNVSEEQRKMKAYIDKLNNDYNLKYQQQTELLNSIKQKIVSNEEIDLRLRQDLESKLGNLMTNTINDTDKLKLDLNELTIGNLVDNNYSLEDINNQLQQFNIKHKDISELVNNTNNIENQLLKYSVDKIQNNMDNDINNDISSLINMVKSVNVDIGLNIDESNHTEIDNNVDESNNDETNQELSILNDNNDDYQNIKKKDISELLFN